MKSALSGIALLLLFNTAIAALLTLIGFGHDFPVNLLISQCIGGSIGLVNTPIIPRIAPGWRRWAVLAVTLPASVLLGIGIAVQFSDLSIPLEKLWQTLAIGLMFGVLGSIVFLLAERVHSLDTEVRQRNLAEAERSRRELEAHLRLLQAQIEPHFLFNTLANVASLIDSDAAQARRLLLRLIGWLRVALNRVRQERSSLGDELDLLENWLEILSIRFGPRLAWSFAVTPEARRADLPPMLLQPLLENALKHGIEPKLGGGRLHVAARVEAGRLRIEVSDDGVGLAESHATASGQGAGLENIRARLAALYGDAGRLRVRSNAQAGVTAELELPCAS